MLSTRASFHFILLLFTVLSQLVPASVLPSNNGLIVKREAPGRWFYYGVTGDELTNVINQFNARITKLRVVDPNVPTFAAAIVENTGSFATSWWWWWGVQGSEIDQKLSGSPAKRLISLDPYESPDGLRFAMVMVDNTGLHAKAWWYWWGYDGPTLGSFLPGRRLIELRPYLESGNRVFAAIAIAADGICWEWWYGESIDFIASQIDNPSACNPSMRVTNLAPDPTGGWTAILTQHTDEWWWWWYGISPQTVLSNLGNDKDSNGIGSRLVDISPYGGGNSYASVEIGDESPPQVVEI